MELAQIIEIVNKELNLELTAESVIHSGFSYDIPSFCEGNTDLGYCKKVGDKFITINERCDSTFKTIEHEAIAAIGVGHYHKQGFVHGLTIYLKNE